MPIPELVEPTYTYDAFFVMNGRRSPLCGVKLWLPMDCHEDARIEVLGTDITGSAQTLAVDVADCASSLNSDIDPKWGLEIEAHNVHVASAETKLGVKTLATSIVINHVDRVVVSKRFSAASEPVADPQEKLTWIQFRLSPLSYSIANDPTIVDYRGNRHVKLQKRRNLKIRAGRKVLSVSLDKRWDWTKEAVDRVVAVSCPVLTVRNCSSFSWSTWAELHQMGRDACLLLSLAARHLVVVHGLFATSKAREKQEWTYPLERQRSTRNEALNGPLVDESKLEDYFSAATVRWADLTGTQRDVVRMAVYSLNPFMEATSEGTFLHMFTALEGLASVWFPAKQTLAEKISKLISMFPPRASGLWPITSTDKDGLSVIRNHLAHGGIMEGAKHEALSVATDHLQMWIEKILLSILGFSQTGYSRDRLSQDVSRRMDDLPRLRAAMKAGG